MFPAAMRAPERTKINRTVSASGTLAAIPAVPEVHLVLLNSGGPWNIELPASVGNTQRLVLYYGGGSSQLVLASTYVKTGMAIPLFPGDRLVFWADSTMAGGWFQEGGSVGMGQFVPVAEPDTIGDWIAVSTTTMTDVDISDDSCRKGACAAYIMWGAGGTTAESILQVRKNGASMQQDVGYTTAVAGATGGEGTFIVPLDNNAIFEAKWTVSKGGTSWARVCGYFL